MEPFFVVVAVAVVAVTVVAVAVVVVFVVVDGGANRSATARARRAQQSFFLRGIFMNPRAFSGAARKISARLEIRSP